MSRMFFRRLQSRLQRKTIRKMIRKLFEACSFLPFYLCWKFSAFSFFFFFSPRVISAGHFSSRHNQFLLDSDISNKMGFQVQLERDLNRPIIILVFAIGLRFLHPNELHRHHIALFRFPSVHPSHCLLTLLLHLIGIVLLPPAERIPNPFPGVAIFSLFVEQAFGIIKVERGGNEAFHLDIISCFGCVFRLRGKLERHPIAGVNLGLLISRPRTPRVLIVLDPHGSTEHHCTIYATARMMLGRKCIFLVSPVSRDSGAMHPPPGAFTLRSREATGLFVLLTPLPLSCPFRPFVSCTFPLPSLRCCLCH